MKKILMLILDGMPDAKERDTTLEIAKIDNLNKLASDGLCGMIENNINEHPGSGESHFHLLGYEQDEYPGRGYAEAIGIGIQPKTDELCLRANFATVSEKVEEKAEGQFGPKLILKDRRAARETTGLKELAQSISEINIEGMTVRLHKSLGHRAVLTINNVESSLNIIGNDPHKINVEVPEVKPTSNDNKAAKTVATLNKWSNEVYKILKDHKANTERKVPANYVIFRGPGKYKYVKTLKEKQGLDGAVVAGSPIVKGIGKILDMEVPDLHTATADYNTDLRDKTLKALELLEKKDLVLLHVKATDIAAHDKNPEMKKAMVEKVDREVLGRILEYVDFNKTVLAVVADHPTSLETGDHEAGFIPFIFYTLGIEKNNIESYNEKQCKNGPIISMDGVMEKLISLR
ncbi:MAG: 2,3-bisphosphoglycerate-independent phosphoglycerate mutase [Candidatus Aenigmarchaeota archaeon]|nr:2,3-bisphosphoglycerate-independent phosphoglycerate mutase [Candidatus Aenigmarchaeota archaeon]